MSKVGQDGLKMHDDSDILFKIRITAGRQLTVDADMSMCLWVLGAQTM